MLFISDAKSDFLPVPHRFNNALLLSSMPNPSDGNPSDGNPSDGNPSDGNPSDDEPKFDKKGTYETTKEHTEYLWSTIFSLPCGEDLPASLRGKNGKRHIRLIGEKD